MENVKAEKQSRRSPFADMAKVGEVLERDGRLSISRIQRNLACGFTYASHIIDYLVDIGELYEVETGVYLSERLTPRALDNGLQPSQKRRIVQTFNSAKSGDVR